MKIKIVLIFTFFFSTTISYVFGINPLSKIKITSNSAIGQKLQNIPNAFSFTYKDNVEVTFSDDSKINADQLEIILDTSKLKNDLDKNSITTSLSSTATNKNDLSIVKKITFKNNVHFAQANKTIDADLAELYLADKKCKLLGNVKIKQIKQRAKDLPIVTECQETTLDLQSEQITFVGSTICPVSTVIELEGKTNFMSKPKTKEQKRTRKKSFFHF